MGCIRHHQAAIRGWIQVLVPPEELLPKALRFSLSLVSRIWELKVQRESLSILPKCWKTKNVLRKRRGQISKTCFSLYASTSLFFQLCSSVAQSLLKETSAQVSISLLKVSGTCSLDNLVGIPKSWQIPPLSREWSFNSWVKTIKWDPVWIKSPVQSELLQLKAFCYSLLFPLQKELGSTGTLWISVTEHAGSWAQAEKLLVYSVPDVTSNKQAGSTRSPQHLTAWISDVQTASPRQRATSSPPACSFRRRGSLCPGCARSPGCDLKYVAVSAWLTGGSPGGIRQAVPCY